MEQAACRSGLRRSNSELSRRSSGRQHAYSPVPKDGQHELLVEAGLASAVVAKPPIDNFEGFTSIFMDHAILTSMLLSVPIGYVAHFSNWASPLRFGFNFVGIIPLAWLIGKSTEDVAAAVGETAGGLLNATFGNLVEMLLCFAGLRSGEIVLVQCTLIGSILSNLLLVLGTAFFVGGCYYKTQKFSLQGASTQCSLMVMAVFAIGLPTVYANLLKQDEEWAHIVKVSRWSSVLLLLTYICYLWFQMKTHSDLFESEGGAEEEEQPDLSPCCAACLLGTCTVVTSFSTHFLIDSINGTVDQWQLSREFIGIIMLPIIGNAVEHYTAVIVAARNKMDLSLGVAVGSSCQMALLVTPITVLFGWATGVEMTLDFHAFQLAVLMLAVFLATSVLSDGTSNWMEGLMLLVTYIVLVLIYFFEGSGKDASLATIA